MLPTGLVLQEPRKLTFEDNCASVGHRIASHARDRAAIDTPSDAFITMLLVADLEFNGRARPKPVAPLYKCAPCRHVEYLHVVSRSNSGRHDLMIS